MHPSDKVFQIRSFFVDTLNHFGNIAHILGALIVILPQEVLDVLAALAVVIVFISHLMYNSYDLCNVNIHGHQVQTPVRIESKMYS